MLSIDLDAGQADSASFAVRRQDLYSISYLCTVRDAAGRRSAWRALEATALSKDWTPGVDVVRAGGAGSVLLQPVERTGLSSWNERHLYVELARAELAPGEYEVRHAVPLPAENPPCENSLVVTPAYVGK